MTERGKRWMSRCNQRKEPCWKCAQHRQSQGLPKSWLFHDLPSRLIKCIPTTQGPNSFLMLLQQLQAKAPPQHACFMVSLQLAKSSSWDCFSFCFIFKAHQKMWVAVRTGTAAAGWGWWSPGRVAWWLLCLQPTAFSGRTWTTRKRQFLTSQLDMLQEPAKDNLNQLLIEPRTAYLPSPYQFWPRWINYHWSQHLLPIGWCWVLPQNFRH